MKKLYFKKCVEENIDILVINYLARKVGTCVVATRGSVNYFFFVSNNDTSAEGWDKRCSFA